MNKAYQYINFVTEKRVVTVTLNRPEVHNAFHFEMLNEILDLVLEIKNLKPEILLIKGNGKSFCAGADIKWFSNLNNLQEKELRKQLKILQKILWELYQLSVVKIAELKGSVMGGGIGLSAACDFVIAEKNTKMAFREVRLGITPALISPFVIRKTGVQAAKEWMLSGSLIDIKEAHKAGLVDYVVESNQMDETTNKLISDLIKSGPVAKQKIKELISVVDPYEIKYATLEIALENLISVIKSREAKEGFNAFLEKRKPVWL